MNTSIVTGANGFIGKALCKELSKQGEHVIAIVRNSDSDMSELKELANLDIIICPMEDYSSLPDLVKDGSISVWYQLAWDGTSGTKRGDYLIQLDNVKYTCEAIYACEKIGCKRFVFASSIMEYEINATMETRMNPGINTLYSTAKLTADYMARAIACKAGIDFIRVVISNVYGPGETSPRLINSSLRKLLAGEHCSFSAGDQMYDFIYIDDAARGFAYAGAKGVANSTYYLGSHNPMPLKQFLCEMRDVASEGTELGLGEIPFAGISLKYDEFDIWALTNDTGFEAKTTFKDGIAKTIAWIERN